MGNLTVKESGEMVNIISPNVSKITSFKVHFSPKQEGTGDPSPENVREIVGWNGVEGYKCGKSIAHIVGYSAVGINEPYADKSLTNNYGTTINTTEPINEVIVTQSTWNDSRDKYHYSNGYFGIIDDNLLFGQKYKVSFKVTNITNNPLNSDLSDIRIVPPRGNTYETYIDGNYIYGVINYLPHPSLPNRHGIEIHNCGMSFTMSDFMVTAVDNEDYIYEPFQNTTTSIDWTDTIGNIYGGYVDLITGEIYKNYEQIIFNGTIRWTSITNYDNFNRFIYYKQSLPLLPQNNAICYFNYLTNGSGQIGNGFIGSTGNVLIYTDKNINSIDSLMEYQTNNPLQLVYELETPVQVTTLSPTQLSTLKGQNNFWSNADYVEIEYELTETFDIQKAKRKIILNQPHVESTSGTIAKPETDMIGKIKECKIHFMPVQQSDSDPTPDNIVPITGWTGIDVYQAFVEYPITPIAKTTTGYGVKWVVDKDGLMTAYGTPTAFTGANLGEIDVNGDETLYGIIVGNLNNVTFNKPALLDSNNKSVTYIAGDGILQTGLDLSLYNDIKKVRVSLKRSGNVFMSGSCNAIVWKDKKPTISTTTIDWTNIAGTIYGGYVDLISGELVQEFKQCKINELSWSYIASGACFVTSRNTPNDILKSRSLLISYIRSDYYTPIDGYGDIATYNNFQDYSISLYLPSDQHRIAIKDSRFTDVSSFLSAMGDTYIWYRLAEPTVTYQLTPQQLTTLRGINNIWSSANGEVEIKYWKH